MVSEKWINEMIEPYVYPKEKYGNNAYGYLWWLVHEQNESIAAVGDGGNIIYINRKENIVVAITGYFKPLVLDRIDFIEKNIIPVLIK